jgi:hypothetical protein
MRTREAISTRASAALACVVDTLRTLYSNKKAVTAAVTAVAVLGILACCGFNATYDSVEGAASEANAFRMSRMKYLKHYTGITELQVFTCSLL